MTDFPFVVIKTELGRVAVRIADIREFGEDGTETVLTTGDGAYIQSTESFDYVWESIRAAVDRNRRQP